MKTVIEMAKESGFKASTGKTDKEGVYHPYINALGKDIPVEWLERFAELVRADERGRMCEQLKECSSEKSTSNEANRSAVLGEGGQAN